MKQHKLNWPELGIAVVTAATIFTSVVCNHWAIALGVVVLLDLANKWRKHLDEEEICNEKQIPNEGDDQMIEGG